MLTHSKREIVHRRQAAITGNRSFWEECEEEGVLSFDSTCCNSLQPKYVLESSFTFNYWLLPAELKTNHKREKEWLHLGCGRQWEILSFSRNKKCVKSGEWPGFIRLLFMHSSMDLSVPCITTECSTALGTWWWRQQTSLPWWCSRLSVTSLSTSFLIYKSRWQCLLIQLRSDTKTECDYVWQRLL